jgi:hypothetical protein
VVPDGRRHASLLLGYPGGGEVGFSYGTRAEMRELRDVLVRFLAAFAAGAGPAPRPGLPAGGQAVEVTVVLRPVDDLPPWRAGTPAERLADAEAVVGELRDHLVRALARGLAVAGWSVGGDHFGGG